MSDNPTPEAPPAGDEGKQEQAFTQADVDRIVRERVKREREKYADYDELKSKVGQVATAEERIAALEREVQSSRLEAAVARITSEFGLDAKQAIALKYAPSEEAAREIAEGLSAAASEQKKNGNHVPREGNNPQPGSDPMRAFANDLFGRATAD